MNDISNTSSDYFNYTKVSQRLKELREEKGLTQGDVAQYLGKSDVQSISKWENRRAFPEFEMLRSLRQLYDVSFDYLLGIDDFRNKGNKEFSELTGLSDESIEVLRNNKKSGNNQYLQILDLLLSDEELFNNLMGAMCSLVFPSHIGIPISHNRQADFVILTPEEFNILAEHTPDKVFHRIRTVLEEFAKKNSDKRQITPNEYHPIISELEEVVEYGKY